MALEETGLYNMKLLLTSNGLSNKSIADALEKLVGKPRKEIKVAFIPTAAFPEDDVVHESRDWLVDDMYRIKEFCGYMDIVSIADLPNEALLKRLAYADVIFVGGGNAFYLSYCMEQAGLFDALPSLLESRVYAGISAGSMIATASLRSTSRAIRNTKDFLEGRVDAFGPSGRSGARTAHLVDFVVRPHMNKRTFGDDFLEKIAADVGVSVYAIDDESAIRVVDGVVDVISEGSWRLI